jgi:homoserine O-acetyltransferase/O-succinyltransferase
MSLAHEARHLQISQARFTLELGGELRDVEVAFETWGKLNRSKDNAVLICHALSGDSHTASHSKNDSPGWWEVVVGPGKSIDTDKHFVICVNALGGCRGTTGPASIDPATRKPYGADFPDITMLDIVRVQQAVVDELKIKTLYAVVGGSMGGQQVLVWGTQLSHRLGRAIVIASAPRLTSQALAFDIVGRNAILRDNNFNAGQFYDQDKKPDTGLAIARMLGHITYLSREGMTEKFDADRFNPRDIDTRFEKYFSVGSYLAYQGKKFVERFDANSYVTLTRAMDRFDMGDSIEALRPQFQQSTCDHWLVMSFTSDWLFPSEQSRQMVGALQQAGKQVSYCEVQSSAGHDAFLLEDSLDTYGGLIRAFLDNPPSTSLKQLRPDFARMLKLIPKNASVLDLGCGDGELLAQLRHINPKRKLAGLELDQANVLATIAKGMTCIQADLNRRLTMFADGQFDVVLLSQTLQSVISTEQVLEEMLRVGKRCVVSFPNFAYKPLREMLYAEGRSPKSPGLYSYEWYNTPNRRFASLLDFQEYCGSRRITIEREMFLNTRTGKEVKVDANLHADLGIFVLSRQS